MIGDLVSCLLQYKTTCEYNNMDLNADRSQCKFLRTELVKRYTEYLFGLTDEAISMIATKEMSFQEKEL